MRISQPALQPLNFAELLREPEKGLRDALRIATIVETVSKAPGEDGERAPRCPQNRDKLSEVDEWVRAGGRKGSAMPSESRRDVLHAIGAL